MTTTGAPMCLSCVHFDQDTPRDVGDPPRCEAFPDGIPNAIFWDGRIDHRKPWPGDGGVRFEQDPDLEEFDFENFEETRGSGGRLGPSRSG